MGGGLDGNRAGLGSIQGMPTAKRLAQVTDMCLS